MEGLVLALVAVAIVAAIAGLKLVDHLRRKRREELAALAPQLGLNNAPKESYRCVALPFSLVRRGDRRGADDLIQGTWQDIDVRTFDYWYQVESTNHSTGATTTTTYRFSCAVTDVDARMPPLVVSRETMLTRLADVVAIPDIEFELEEFNRAFTVKCKDRRFAHDFCDQRMMRWLMGTAPVVSFEVSGRWLLAYAKRLRPRELVALLGTLREFRERIPTVVYDLYPPPSNG